MGKDAIDKYVLDCGNPEPVLDLGGLGNPLDADGERKERVEVRSRLPCRLDVATEGFSKRGQVVPESK